MSNLEHKQINGAIAENTVEERSIEKSGEPLTNQFEAEDEEALAAQNADEEEAEEHRNRRGSASTIDYFLSLATYMLIIELFYYITGVERQWPSGIMASGFAKPLNLLFAWVFMMLIEPFFIRIYGTTPGGAILGIRIHKDNGDLLTFEEALKRQWSFIYHTYKILTDNVYLENSKGEFYHQDNLELKSGGRIAYTLEDVKWYRRLMGFVVSAGCVGIIVLILIFQMIPQSRGDLTIAEFAANYNYSVERANKYYEYERLDENVNWINVETGEIMDRIVMGYLPKLEFEMKNGYVVGVSYEIKINEYSEYSDFVVPYNRKMRDLALALLAAQEEVSLKDKLFFNIGKEIKGAENFRIVKGNVTITNVIEHKGYEYDEEKGFFSAKDNESEYLFSQKFSVRKE